MNFIAPNHSNHTDTRRCVYDAKINKMDIRLSMGSGALCDDCREALLAGEPPISATQFNALNMLFAESGRLLDSPPRKPRVFIGSSSEGLSIACEIQALLHRDFTVEVWNQNTVFELGNATLEDLEAAVLKYDFGIFVCTADDKLESRGETKSVARDNVLFEYGLFVGKLTRKRAFIVRSKTVPLPSDLAGIHTATYDPTAANITAALGPACEEIRQKIAQETNNRNGQY